jgi:hypothetical protein
MRYFKALFFLLSSAVFLLLSCEKIYDNKIPPVLILNGLNPSTVLIGCTYRDAGAYAKDDNSNPVITVSGIVNTDSIGVYYLNYTATDIDGNQSFAQRKVIVRPFGFDLFEGTFIVHDTIISIPRQIKKYPVSVSLQNPNQRIFRISNFNNYGSNFTVNFQPDSAGNFQINFNQNDTIIQGSGQASCPADGFRITYFVQSDTEYPFQHKATFKK